MLYDSHCHLDFPALDADREAVVARARDAGVEAILVPGVEPGQWERAAGLRVAGLRLRLAFGFHPMAIGPRAAVTTDAARSGLDALAEAIERHGAAAVGEIGWDANVEADRGAQDGWADAQIELARALGRPVILHVVKEHGHALERLARWAPLAGVVHAYSGSAELVDRYVGLGLHVALGPSVTRPDARRPREAAARVPDDRLLLETDAPDQRPPGRERGEPADVLTVARAVAEARGEALDEVAALAHRNAVALFG